MGSIAKVVRDLEDVPKFVSREIFPNSHASPLFDAILEGGEVCNSSLSPPQSESIVPTTLPHVLHIQLDNACSDNKNRYTFCFFSLLVANGVFREVYVNFMMDGESIPVIPHLVEEVPDFKGFIDTFIYKKDKALQGHTAA
jgi:hypothetical protein